MIIYQTNIFETWVEKSLNICLLPRDDSSGGIYSYSGLGTILSCSLLSNVSFLSNFTSPCEKNVIVLSLPTGLWSSEHVWKQRRSCCLSGALITIYLVLGNPFQTEDPWDNVGGSNPRAFLSIWSVVI